MNGGVSNAFHTMGILSAIAAVSFGIVYMTLAGAPARYLIVNATALILGLSIVAISARLFPNGVKWRATAVLLSGGVLLATALLGISIEGASRWVAIGPVFLQPSLIVLPFMIVAFAADRNFLSAIGIVLAAVAVAIQPDRAMAGMLVAGLVVIVSIRRDPLTLSAFVAAIAAFIVTMMRPDNLPAVPYVDQIFYTSYDVHLLAGLAVSVGAAILLLPAIYGVMAAKSRRTAYLAFGAAWLAAIIAAALGNYPTPLVGYGASSILGYALCFLAMPAKLTANRSSHFS